MIEARAVILSIEETKKKLQELGAVYKGEYCFKDVVFVPRKENFNLSDDFLRMRVYAKTNWPIKHIGLVRKQTEFKSEGKVDNVGLKKEFDIEKEALDFIEKNLSSEFRQGFEFSRTGWEYQLGQYRIFVEDIERFKPTIEVEAETEEELSSLFEKIGIVEKIHESTPEMMRHVKM